MKYFIILFLFLNTGFAYGQNNDFGSGSKYYDLMNFDHRELPRGVISVVFDMSDSLKAESFLEKLKMQGWHDVRFFLTKNGQIVVYPDDATTYFCDPDCFASKYVDRCIVHEVVEQGKEYHMYSYLYAVGATGSELSVYRAMAHMYDFKSEKGLENFETEILSTTNFPGEEGLWRVHWRAYVKM